MTARQRILERRARFLAAATAIGAAVLETACEPQVCLETVPPNCAAELETIEGPTSLCLGQVAELRYYATVYCDQRTDRTADAQFTSKNPAVLVIENSRFVRATGLGQANITANYNDDSGYPATLTIEVTACADAATDG